MLVVILTTSFFNGQQTKASQIEDRKIEYEIMQQVKQDLVQETYVGEFLISHYCPCSICCGWSNGPTASGVMPEVGVTIAASSEFEFGTKLKIGDQIYTVQDRGGVIKGNRIDVFCATHQQALNKGLYTTDVYLVEEKNQIVEYAERFVGNPYIWGGDSLTRGCDCSHFVWRVLKNLGYYDGEYVTSDGFLGIGEEIDIEDAAAGDVIVYPGHVAIYDGNGKIIEAQSSSAGITNTRDYNTNSILGVRRFTKDTIN